MLRKHVEEFGDLLRKENEAGLIIDGKVIRIFEIHSCSQWKKKEKECSRFG